MSNWLKTERVSKLEQWEALLMAVTENQIMPAPQVRARVEKVDVLGRNKSQVVLKSAISIAIYTSKVI